MSSMSRKRPISFARNVLRPVLGPGHPRGVALGHERLKTTLLWASKGSLKSSFSATREGGEDSAISMRPFPMFPVALPGVHGARAARRAAVGPLHRGVALLVGRPRTQRWKSSIMGKISAAGAAIVAERSTRNVSGRVAT